MSRRIKVPVYVTWTVFLAAVLVACEVLDESDSIYEPPNVVEVENELECRVFEVIVDYESGEPERDFQCAFEQNDVGMTPGLRYVLDVLPDHFVNEHRDLLQSGRAMLTISGAELADSKIIISANTKIAIKDRALDGGSDGVTKRGATTGLASTLVVRVSGSDLQNAHTIDGLRGDVFGAPDDSVNLASQYKACSYDQKQIVKAVGQGIDDGVLDIALPQNVKSLSKYQIENATQQYVNDQSGTYDFVLSDFDAVLLCYPPGIDDPFVAYAQRPGWLSAYSSAACSSPTLHMHEVGHNLNLSHSGQGSDQYGDTTGTMGIGTYYDEWGKKCFNAAKSSHLGWYDDRKITLNDTWEGKIIGLADYGNSTPEHHVVVRVETTDSNALFLTYNRDKGINSDTASPKDRITIVEASSEILPYRTSWLLGSLNPASPGDEFVESDFRGTGDDLTISIVGSGQDANNVDYVRVNIDFGGPAQNDPPLIDIADPLEGATFTEGDDILINADASDPDGTVTSVSFYANGQLLQEVTSAPFEYLWVSAPAGSHVLTAEATDDGGLKTTSDPVQITVTGGTGEDELVCWLEFDDQNGSTAADSSGFDNSGYLVGDAEFGPDGVELDGIGDFVRLDNSPDINEGIHVQRSIAMWVYVDDVADGGRKQVLYEEGGTVRGLNIYIHAGQLYLGGWNDKSTESGWKGNWIVTDQIQDQTWHHVALTLNGTGSVLSGALKGYLDGALINSADGSQLWNHGGGIAIGALNSNTKYHDGNSSAGTGGDALTGIVSGFRIYNRELTSIQVAELAGTEDELICRLRLDETSGSTAADSSPHGGNNFGTLKNGASFSNDSVSLDGINDLITLVNTPDINLGTHKERTVAMWVYINDVSDPDRKQVLYEEGGTSRGLNIYVYGDRIYVGGWNAPSSESAWQGTWLMTDPIQSETWYHVAFVLNGTNTTGQEAFAGYLNSVQFRSGDGSQLWSHGGGIGIGALNNNTKFHDGNSSGGTGAHGVAGRVMDIRIYNRELTSEEVAALAN